ncbi:MAG: glutamate-5-semialdehyde dehydrogenase [Gammaproteobacteria bacterium]|jgi:glutamate-5-semialdehyde dehydrogenase|nr:glutamate-5-semialdehyde dehydrogenase [Gammaproteobacteria bacterium]MBT4494158.1 glutamate-5-semialdehyde dehydrogenase [Gammaproteobacteria bacterium]MBT7370438.1 glutamate-5-semialdehyde dehydrogenase [Gammaproteobacteria bacterium]
MSEYMQQVGIDARKASALVCRASTELKNDALKAIGDEIVARRKTLMAENEKDLVNGRDHGISEPLLDRLMFTEARFDSMVEGLTQVASLDDPVGEITDMSYQPNGLQIGKMRVPLGVVGIIYESRPNVTIDAASLCLKSGNATILRGGSESIHSNLALAACIEAGLEKTGLPGAAVQVIKNTDRALVGELVTMDKYVDIIVPRGGASLIERISTEATIPVIKHLDGICHVYIDDDADLEKAYAIAINAKVQRYAVCNAMETLLVSEKTASEILPRLATGYQEHDVELRGCQKTTEILGNEVSQAEESDWYEEYLGPILAIRTVSGIDEAIEHINHYGSQHTDSIVTENYTNSRRFLREVDSSSVMVNVSTRFSDGFEYGLGAEVGISTDKLHARGPVGLEGLTSQKYVVFGDGQIRQ